jgi:hypothetical protein
MGRAGSTRESMSATYEIRLRSTPPDALVAEFAPRGVRRTSAQTVLMRRVASQDELASLLERVLAVGLVLNEVHELRLASSPPHHSRPVGGQRTVYRAYEVRIDGELTGPLLRYLEWHSRHLPEHSALSLEGPPEIVHEFLSACCRLGLGIEQVRRVDPGLGRKEPRVGS